MFCKCQITSNINSGNSVTVIADCREYTYEEVINPDTQEATMEYVDQGSFGTITAFFEKNPVSEEEINERLAILLTLTKGERIVIF